MVNGAQRLRLAVGSGGGRRDCARQSSARRSSTRAGSAVMAGMSQATTRFQSVVGDSSEQCRSRWRDRARQLVGKDRQAEMPELAGIADQQSPSRRLRGRCSPRAPPELFRERAAAPCPGPCACFPARQHKPGGLHERIIALASACGLSGTEERKTCGRKESGYNRIEQKDAILFGTYSGSGGFGNIWLPPAASWPRPPCRLGGASGSRPVSWCGA